jgi:hypothetical protein
MCRRETGHEKKRNRTLVKETHDMRRREIGHEKKKHRPWEEEKQDMRRKDTGYEKKRHRTWEEESHRTWEKENRTWEEEKHEMRSKEIAKGFITISNKLVRVWFIFCTDTGSWNDNVNYLFHHGSSWEKGVIGKS